MIARRFIFTIVVTAALAVGCKQRSSHHTASPHPGASGAAPVVIFASHLHEYVPFTQGGIQGYISGGLGAPVVTKSTEGDPQERCFHHVLQIDVNDAKLDVSVLRFPGRPDTERDDED